MTTIGRSGARDGKIVYIKETSQPEGNLNLSGNNWDTSKSIIKQIKIVTSSTDWDLTFYPTDAFSGGTLPSYQVAQGADGNFTLEMDYPYIDEDNTKEVHIKFTDNSGSNTADITILGEKAR